MTTGKDVLDEYLEITLHLSERATWALVALAGFLALCFIVYAVLPRTGESRLAQRIEALKSWLGIPAASRAVTTLVFGLGLIFTALFTIAVIAAFPLIWSVIAGGSADPSTTPTQSLGLGALLVALLSAPFVIWRSVVAQKTVDVTEQGLITDRINAAVEGLGAEKAVTVTLKDENGHPLADKNGAPAVFNETKPNLEVRIGAIYALERIARENPDFHVQIMEILCAYIRENSPRSSASTSPRERLEDLLADGASYYDADNQVTFGQETIEAMDADWAAGLTPRTDVQAVLTVIGRRTDQQIDQEMEFCKGKPQLSAIDLSKTNLQGVELSGMKFYRANFMGARLDGSQFVETDFSSANLDRCNFRFCLFWDTVFDRGTRTTRTDFYRSMFAQIDATKLRLTKKQLAVILADASLKIDDKKTRPVHWIKRELPANRVNATWDDWLCQADAFQTLND